MVGGGWEHPGNIFNTAKAYVGNEKNGSGYMPKWKDIRTKFEYKELYEIGGVWLEWRGEKRE